METQVHKEDIKQLLNRKINKMSATEVNMFTLFKAFGKQDGFAVLKFTISPDPVLKYASENFKDVMGYAPKQCIGKRISEMISKSDSRVEEIKIVNRLRRGEVVPKIQRLTHKDGSIITVVGLMAIDKGEILEVLINLTELIT